jgi:alpha-1,3-mannosyl-glycoprotein beta-1,2-N-acetylglucosaminyltransferase
LTFFLFIFSGLFYEKHLKFIELTDQTFPFSKHDLTYLLKENYDKTFENDVYQAPVVTLDELRRDLVTSKGPVRIQYSNRNQYKSAAKALGIMDDFKVKI